MMRRLLLIGVVLAASGCADTDPYRREGMWQPEGVNAGNIAAMAADPHDLVRGRGSDGTARRVPAAAVRRFWEAPSAPFGTTPAKDAPTDAKPAGG